MYYYELEVLDSIRYLLQNALMVHMELGVHCVPLHVLIQDATSSQTHSIVQMGV